ncbi:MAG TPA: HRDC domain-containing protein [Myxococcota bacterium]|nr:HRDC domain-containing protein [Myxococcota bacterium]HNZ04756.1 HRDC domain-containing protein [Myxococcota bacterium]HPB51816.1 HRDC domain-containing protein [Myxococcota bacterium]
MKARVFTLRFNRESGTVDDHALTDFLTGRRLVSFSDHCVVYDNEPVVIVAVTYHDENESGARAEPTVVRPNPRDELGDCDRAVYDALRSWRNAKAEAVGKPGYIVLTNRQLAEVARSRPRSLTALGAIDGVGAARVSSHGQEILAVLAGFDPSIRQSVDEPSGSDHE